MTSQREKGTSRVMLRAAVLSALLLFAASASSQERVLTDQEALLVTYRHPQTGATLMDTYVIEYVGWLDSAIWETGEASKPLEGHPIDDRVCHLRARSWVDRNVFLVHPVTGTHHDSTKYQRRITEIGDASGREPSFKLDDINSWQGENCGKMSGEFSGRIAAVRRNLQHAFSGLVKLDRADLIQQLERELNIVDITSER